jgi:hypothetical protein
VEHGPVLCDDCGTEIVFSKTEAGKTMPVERRSSERGRIVYRKGRAHQLTNEELENIDPDVPRYAAHFHRKEKQRP